MKKTELEKKLTDLINSESRENDSKQDSVKMKWIKWILKSFPLICRHEWKVHRTGDHCAKCDRFRENIWY